MTAPDQVQNTQDQRRSQVNRGALLVGVLTLLALALGFSGLGVYSLLKTRQAQAWPTTTGQIFRSQVGVSSSSGSPMYAPDVAYRYQVGGQEYQGTQLTLSMWSASTSDRTRIAAEVAHYPVGQTVDVRYDPERPAVSALKVPAAPPLWPLVVGGLLLLPSGLLLWLWRRGSLKTLIQTGAVGQRIEYRPETGVQRHSYDGHSQPADLGVPQSGGGVSVPEQGKLVFSWSWNGHSAQPGSSKILGGSLFILALVFGGLSLAFGPPWATGDRALREAQEHWVTTSGRVISSEIRSPEANLYLPAVAYEYEVAGQTYRSERLTLGDQTFRTSDRAQVAEQVALYRPGAEVTVHYDPHSPEDAALELRQAGGGVRRTLSWIFAGVAALCLLLCAALWRL